MKLIPARGYIIRSSFTIIIIASLIIPLLLLTTGGAVAETYVFSGSTRSQVHITQTTTITATSVPTVTNGSKFIYNATYPQYTSVDGYSASYSNVQIGVSPTASSVSGIMTDHYGNQYKQYEWDGNKITSPTFTITVTTQFDADVTGDASPVTYDDPRSMSVSSEYLGSTTKVQSGAQAIINEKDDLLSGVTKEAVAVDRIMDFVRTNIPTPQDGVANDAVSSLNNHAGNCVNRAHLALALLRSAGIPARCVSGVLYGNPYPVSYNVPQGRATAQINWGSGSHVWVEVYYPQEDAWVAYDPWMDKGFVDSRHVKLATSKDYDNGGTPTRGDAGILYTAGLSSKPSVSITTGVAASSLRDTISLNYQYTKPLPTGVSLMMARDMQSAYAPTARPPTPTPTPIPNGSVTPTPTPGNTTATPTPGNATVTVSPNPGGIWIAPTPLPGGPATNYASHNVTGTILDATTGAPINGATVMLDTIQISASEEGKFMFLYAVADGSYVLSVSAPGYLAQKQVIMPNNTDMTLKVKLVPLATTATPSASKPGIPAPDILLAAAALLGGTLLWRKKGLE